jgi:hypothetical protein
MVVGAIGLTMRALHVVVVSNRLHKSGEKSIPSKLQNDSAYVMLLHNKWGVPQPRQTGWGRGDKSLVG